MTSRSPEFQGTLDHTALKSQERDLDAVQRATRLPVKVIFFGITRGVPSTHDDTENDMSVLTHPLPPASLDQDKFQISIMHAQEAL